ncbi:hypothetical protein [Streptomyces cupreus]|uniref:Uncharacterized protein n=1 Tax=Streptomyces cupreus TaxID=2759956 RepID=A0A7X1IXZ4_9ACTN|nr:hypothetical protein [Streptomyces cupreus]MBC2900646.1 hypothetical protein [Streptomyces cupreus]
MRRETQVSPLQWAVVCEAAQGPVSGDVGDRGGADELADRSGEALVRSAADQESGTAKALVEEGVVAHQTAEGGGSPRHQAEPSRPWPPAADAARLTARHESQQCQCEP